MKMSSGFLSERICTCVYYYHYHVIHSKEMDNILVGVSAADIAIQSCITPFMWLSLVGQLASTSTLVERDSLLDFDGHGFGKNSRFCTSFVNRTFRIWTPDGFLRKRLFTELTLKPITEVLKCCHFNYNSILTFQSCAECINFKSFLRIN